MREQRAGPTSPLKNADSQDPRQLTWTSSGEARSWTTPKGQETGAGTLRFVCLN